MLINCLFIILFILFNFVPTPEARIYLDINAPTFVQIPIVIPKWKPMDKSPPDRLADISGKVYETIKNDLQLSGFFKVIDYQLLPPNLQKKEGIPSILYLEEWMATEGEVLLAGEVLWGSVALNIKLRFHLIDLVEKKHIVGKEYEAPLQELRTIAHRVSDEVIYQITGEKGVNSTKIVYLGQKGEGREIFIVDFDGANIKQVTQNQSINVSPVWTPDNRKIAFTSYLRRNPDLYLIDIDGKNLQRLIFYPGLNLSPSWSPDGKKMALMMGMEGKSEIFILDSESRVPRKLTKSHGNEASPSWSPDGKWIAFVSDRLGSPQIYIMTSDGSNVRRLTFEGNYNTQPSWSPKGDRIAFCGRVEGHLEIFTIRPDGTGLQRLTSNSGNNESPCWSPDGRYIAFSSTRTRGSKIFIMNSNGSNQRPLTTSKGGESSPNWSKRFE